MHESRMLKAKCRKTGRYYGLEIREFDGVWKVVNVVSLTEDERKIISSEIRQPCYETNQNLLACEMCGGRKVGACSCARKKYDCSYDMKYRFGCIYCDLLEIDYSRSSLSGPYTKWAGVSNIPDAIKDKYGNPQGSQYDLAQDGSFAGYRIIILKGYGCDLSMPIRALQQKGFDVVEYNEMVDVATLKKLLKDDKSQLWIISDRISHMTEKHVNLIADYFNTNHGVYIWGDNDPFYAEANMLLNEIFNINMHGNSRGDQVLGIQNMKRGPGIVANHPITTGIQSFYEGITIAEINTGNIVTPLIYGSNGKVVAAYYDKRGKRAIADGGFTRLYYKWDSAGTDRYIVNAAAWLANIEYFGYNS